MRHCSVVMISILNGWLCSPTSKIQSTTTSINTKILEKYKSTPRLCGPASVLDVALARLEGVRLACALVSTLFASEQLQLQQAAWTLKLHSCPELIQPARKEALAPNFYVKSICGFKNVSLLTFNSTQSK